MNKTFKSPGLSATLQPRGVTTATEARIIVRRILTPPGSAPRLAWRALVEATFALDDSHQWEGKLPAGVSAQQFRTMLQRQARAMGGRIGVRVHAREREWWCWPLERPAAAELERKPRRKRNEVVRRVMEERGCSRSWAHQILKREAESKCQA